VWLLHDLELSTGMRWGEVSALRVDDITFTGIGGERQANIHVVRAWVPARPGRSVTGAVGRGRERVLGSRSAEEPPTALGRGHW
jgi:hypothetical protein